MTEENKKTSFGLTEKELETSITEFLNSSEYKHEEFIAKLSEQYVEKFRQCGETIRSLIIEKILLKLRRYPNIFYGIVAPYATKYGKFWQTCNGDFDGCNEGYSIDDKYLLSFCPDIAMFIYKVKDDEIIPHVIDYEACYICTPDDTKLGYITNEMEVKDVKRQIVEKGLKGYYILDEKENVKTFLNE